MSTKSGQMMIEVLLALSVVVLVLVALTAAAVVSVRNTTFAKNTVLANSYMQEGIEAARKERDRADDWDSFKNEFNGNLGFAKGDEKPSGSCPSTPNIDGFFTRCVDFSDSTPPDSREVTVVVSWSESSRNHSSQASVILTKWE